MNKRLVKISKAAFRHHNDGKALVTLLNKPSFEALIVINRDMESITPSGDITCNEIHIDVLHLGAFGTKVQGAKIKLLDTDVIYRCDKKISDDGCVISLAVTLTVDDAKQDEEFEEASTGTTRTW